MLAWRRFPMRRIGSGARLNDLTLWAKEQKSHGGFGSFGEMANQRARTITAQTMPACAEPAGPFSPPFLRESGEDRASFGRQHADPS